MRKFWLLLKRTFTEWNEDKAPRLAAALAYYAGFSLAPILVIAIAVASIFFDRQVVQDMVVAQIQGLAGVEGGELINTMLDASRDLGSNLLAVSLGIVALTFGATGFFGQLQDALNTMWEVAPKPGHGVVGVLKNRFFSFAMVVSIGFLLLVSLVISTGLAALEQWGLGLFMNFTTLIQIANFLISFVVITLLYALLFKYVPDAQIQWRDVWLGAAVSALLFSLGKTFIGLYLGNSSTINQFGGAGSLVAILVWVYYSAQISFLGAEFTQVYANMYGSRVVPAENAVSLSEDARLEQGIPREEQIIPAEKKIPLQAPEINPLVGSSSRSTHFPDASGTHRDDQQAGVQALLASFLVTTFVSLLSGFLLGHSGKSK